MESGSFIEISQSTAATCKGGKLTNQSHDHASGCNFFTWPSGCHITPVLNITLSLPFDNMALLSLPDELLSSLPGYLDDIEDFVNLSSTCSRLRSALDRTLPTEILRLAAAQATTFFRPSPWFLVAATARELGDWARQSEANENALALAFRPHRHTLDGVLDLAVQHCGLTMQRIRELHKMRFDVMGPVADRIDELYAPIADTGRAEDGEDSPDDVSRYGNLSTDSEEVFLLCVIYGELFGPDLHAVLHPDASATARRLSVLTRMEYVKYCCPGWFVTVFERPDPEIRILGSGQWGDGGYTLSNPRDNVVWALLCTQQSRRWIRHWQSISKAAGCDLAVWDDLQEYQALDWRRKLWLNVLLLQGFEGFEMISPVISEDERLRRWGPRLREWSTAIASLEAEPPRTPVGRKTVPVIPCFLEEVTASFGLQTPPRWS